MLSRREFLKLSGLSAAALAFHHLLPNPNILTTGCDIYIVKSGDGLMKIGRDLGIPWQEIAKINNLRPPYRLFRGQQLQIPCANRPEQPANTEADLPHLSYIGISWPHDIGRLNQTLNQIHANWFYSNWNPDLQKNYPGYVPITRCGLASELNGLDPNYSGYLLVFNEPNQQEPNGCPLSPSEAAQRYNKLREVYPKAKMIVGNVSVWELGTGYGNWLPTFSDLISNDPPFAWGTHAYVEHSADYYYNATPEKIRGWVSNFTSQHPDQEMWITEAAVWDGNTDTIKGLFKNLGQISAVTHVDVWTDYQIGANYDLSGYNVNLINPSDGSLTPVGETIAKLSASRP